MANDRKLDLFEKVPIDWSGSHAMDSLYAALFRMRERHLALRQGAMVKLPQGQDSVVYAFMRTLGNDRVIVALNFSHVPQRVQCTLPAENGLRAARFHDAFTGEALPTEEGTVTFDVAPRGWRILE